VQLSQFGMKFAPQGMTFTNDCQYVRTDLTWYPFKPFQLR
jgi:hypothetical protein